MDVLTTGLDIWLHGRKGPKAPFTPEQIKQIDRTVRRDPEVFVMVSSGGATRGAVRSDLAYIGQYGHAEIETDRGEILRGTEAPETIINKWNIDIALGVGQVKQSFSVTLSMAEGTPPAAVLSASRAFAVDNFSPDWRWAMALHTDRPHPHTHIVVKAQGRDGARLRITRETLRDWRLSFAQKMRDQGIEANATLKAARGQFREPKEERGLFFSARSGRSTVMLAKAAQALRELSGEKPTPEPVKEKLIRIRADVLNEWGLVMRQLQDEGHTKLAQDVGKFVVAFEPVRTELEKMKEKLSEDIREKLKESRALKQEIDGPVR